MLHRLRSLWKKPDSVSLGIVLSNQSLTWALIRRGVPDILLSSGAVTLNSRELSEVLDELTKEQHWLQINTHLVLPVGTYQMLLTEAPAVGENELASALRWRISDMLSYDAAEAALDAFALPPDAYRGRQSMAYVAACPKPLIHSYEQSFSKLPLQLQRITIAEVAGLHLGQRLVNEQESWALVFISVQDLHICLMQNQQLYLARQAPLGWARLRSEADYDPLILEIQRSLDYYDSQIGKGTIRQIVISPHLKAAALADYLDQNLTPSVKVMPLPASLEGNLSGAAADELIAIGAAMGPVA